MCSINSQDLGQLIADTRSILPEEVAERFVAVMSSAAPFDVELTFPIRRELLDVYAHRFDSIPKFRERVGWDRFFSVLRKGEGKVGLCSIVVDSWRAIILLDETRDSVLACLIRIPDRA